MNTFDQLHLSLAKPFPSKSIEWRVGSTNSDKTRGTALPYMTARAIQDRFDEAVGPGGWEAKYRVVETEIASRKMAAMFCAISLYVDGKWVTKEDAVEIAVSGESGRGHIDPVKTAVSDAFKRAAVLWGLGRYLYGFDAPWVDLKDGKYFVTQPSLPAHLLPEGDTGVAAPTRSGEAPAAEKAAAPAQAPAPAEKPAAPARQTRAAPAAKPMPAATAEAPAEPAAPAASAETPAPVAAPVEPVAEVPAATETPAPEAAAEQAPAAGGVLALLQGTALETAKNVLDRARTGKAPISLLRNYLKGDSAKKLFSPDAIVGLGAELDTIESGLRAAA